MNIPTLNSAEGVIANLTVNGKSWGIVPSTEEYHAWKRAIEAEFPCEVSVVSKSSLFAFSRSAWRYKHGKPKETESLALGKMVDSLALTPGVFEQEYYVAPEDYNRTTKEGKAMHAAALEAAAGRQVLRPKEAAPARMCAEAVTEALERDGLKMGDNASAQVAMFAFMDSVGGSPLPRPLVVTGCLDILPHEGELLWDLKTTREDVENAQRLQRVCEDFGYGVQAALYTDLYNLCTGEERSRFRFLFVSTQTLDDEVPAVQTRVLEMSKGDLEQYRVLYSRELRAYSLAAATGEWGEQNLPPLHFAASKWEMEKIYNG